ncbi:hypothetical protein [Geminisphaera colitermitum]|uniref:hypothetical protein n=1 Tax=Geminisphaera colitermitum TaxID=1148786 RepID=UPI000158C71F|nr:hypothetical protein [Geminisphaera colitermitum]
MTPTPSHRRLGRNPYVSGIAARDAGQAIDACPVTPRSRFYRLWRSGWADRDSFLRSPACAAQRVAGRNFPL